MAVELISEIVQKNGGAFPLLDSNNLRGGFYSVDNISERDNIPEQRRKTGMLCYVKEDEKYYKLNNDNTWEEAKFGGGGIQIFDQEMLDAADELPEKYITIANKETDLNGSTTSREIKETGTYVDILFSAIRKLQSEVAKLRNSFQYGIYSYTGINTAMSQQVEGIRDPDEEPLWAIEEEDLSSVYSMVIGLGNDLTPESEVDASVDGILKLGNNVIWEYKEDDVSDPKLFLYLSTTGLDIDISLGEYSFNLKDFDISKADSYNIMICLNRNSENSFIYLSIGTGDKTIKEGYLYNNQIVKAPKYINKEYSFKSIIFNNLSLSKLNIYSKYQDFSKQVIPSAPTDQDYKYGAAHLTIRSVKTKAILDSIQNQLPENELIYVENEKRLYIKNNYSLTQIGSGGGSQTEEGMTKEELFKELINMGLVKNTGTEQAPVYEINDFADINLVNQDTGKIFKISVNSDGSIRSDLIPDNTELLSSRILKSDLSLGSTQNVRGFIGLLGLAEAQKAGSKLLLSTDIGLYADRIKIGAFYAPFITDKVYGCNRAFIELENTSDKDFCLKGCYLHFTRPVDNQQTVYHLPLTGTIKAGSTYLIVGKEYAELYDKNVVIKVSSFDQEWFENGELIDFSINPEDKDKKLGYGFAITYGNKDLSYDTSLYKKSSSEDLAKLSEISLSTSDFPRVYDNSFIDAIYYYNMVVDASNVGRWASTAVSITSNTMYKNMFELDPAKQAFQSLNKKDSSRARWDNTNDIWVMDLSSPIIKFPHSDDTYDIGYFSPKASYEKKNVATDKSKLDSTKPNMVTCSFGVDIYTTRCFNWISVGYYDEYLYLRKRGETEWKKFESYKGDSSEFSAQEEYPRRKAYKESTINIIYKRIANRFPGDNTFYTAHKCVIELSDENPASPIVYEYKVGRDDCESDIQTFTIYPKSYRPVIYQVTDQQGFHWVEYQVWAAAATEVYDKIKTDQETNNIIPILINTGDMTQNGTRINEWYDYYQAGRILFKEFEQMNVVGNNDLCGTNVNELGTGDDIGKSNSFYFHVFYCYDIGDDTEENGKFIPIVNNKYIPSLYYFDSANFRFVMINSEITQVNCRDWFGLSKQLSDGNQDVCNIYTGFYLTSKDYNDSFTSVYSMVYHMLEMDKESKSGKQYIIACHEMPFTVITNSSIADTQKQYSRSVGPNGGALIGSHCNQLTKDETGKGTYWLSRLLEKAGVKLCIGGHKHTYACTYPLREYFKFGDNYQYSSDNYSDWSSKYNMESTLQNDNVQWVVDQKNLTKFPLTKRENVGSDPAGSFYPYTADPELQGGVVYFMCQATGFKLTSNKELPSANQKFSVVVPKTSVSGGADKASAEQKYPMFGIIDLNDNYTIKLVRIANILNAKAAFNQSTFGTSDMKLQYFQNVSDNNYGQWVDNDTIMLTI